MAGSRNQYHYEVRRASRSVEVQKAKSLFQASLAADMDLIKEIKNAKSGCKVTTSARTAREVSDIKAKMEELIKNMSIEEVADME